MTELDRLLAADVRRMLDRVAASIPDGTTMTTMGAALPTLARRVEAIEATLAEARAALLDDYARWQRALQDAESVWALAAWRSAAADEPAVTASARAA